MKIKINQGEKIVFFEVGFPTCLGVPQIMRNHFSDFSYQILPYKEFQKLPFPIASKSISSDR